jgi:hypothetical protein
MTKSDGSVIRVEGVTRAQFASGWVVTKRDLILVSFEETPSEKSEIVTKSGIILLGSNSMLNYEDKRVSKIQRTTFGIPHTQRWIEFPDRLDSDGENYKFNCPFIEGDEVEIRGNAFDDMIAGNRVFKLDDGSVALVDTLRIACIRRGGKPVAFGPSVLLEPIPNDEPESKLIIKRDKWKKGTGRIVSIGQDHEDVLRGVGLGSVVLFSTTPYAIDIEDDAIVWEVPISTIWGTEK